MLDLEGFNEINDIGETDKAVVDELRFDDALEIPRQMADVDVWNNYCNQRIYELDKMVRKYLQETRYKREKQHGMKTACPLLFAVLFGRKPGKSDTQVCRDLHILLRYYCTRHTGKSAIAGKRVVVVYHFSPYACRNKRPYSLRLRLEERNDERAFRTYRSEEYKGPKTGQRNLQDGTVTHGKSSKVVRGPYAKTGVPEPRGESKPVPGK